jgi:hypothetical protein
MAGPVNNTGLGASVPSGLCCRKGLYVSPYGDGRIPACGGDRAFRGSANAPAPPAAWLLSPPTVDTHPSNPLRLGGVDAFLMVRN